MLSTASWAAAAAEAPSSSVSSARSSPKAWISARQSVSRTVWASSAVPCFTRSASPLAAPQKSKGFVLRGGEHEPRFASGLAGAIRGPAEHGADMFEEADRRPSRREAGACSVSASLKMWATGAVFSQKLVRKVPSRLRAPWQPSGWRCSQASFDEEQR